MFIIAVMLLRFQRDYLRVWEACMIGTPIQKEQFSLQGMVVGLFTFRTGFFVTLTVLFMKKLAFSASGVLSFGA